MTRIFHALTLILDGLVMLGRVPVVTTKEAER